MKRIDENGDEYIFTASGQKIKVPNTHTIVFDIGGRRHSKTVGVANWLQKMHQDANTEDADFEIIKPKELPSPE